MRKTTPTSFKMPGSTKSVVLILFCCLITFFAFRPILKNGFINWDDNAYVFENPHLLKPLSEAVRFFFQPNYFIGNYVPLTMTAFALQFKYAGLNAGFFHGFSLLVHLANVLLVFVFIYNLSGKNRNLAAFVAVFFGVHPMHVESVAWISEQKDLLYSFFFLSGLIFYHRTLVGSELQDGGSKKAGYLSGIAVVFLLFILSLLAKPAAVVFPLVLLLVDYYLRRRCLKQILLEKIPFIVVALIFGWIALQAQSADKLLHHEHPMQERVLFASYAFISYLVKFFVPGGLSIFYPYPVAVDGRWPSVFYFAPVVVILLIALVFWRARRSRTVVFGLLFFTVNIMLVLQLISFGDAIMADRYTYLPYIGLLFIVGAVIQKFYQKIAHDQIKRGVVQVAVVAFVAWAGYLSHKRSKVWNNDDAMATDLLKKYPDDRLALNNKGYILFEQKRFEEARPLFERAVAIKPDYTMAAINLAHTYMNLGNYEAALQTVDNALVAAATDHNLLNLKGYLLYLTKQYQQAVLFYRSAIEQKPDDMVVYSNLSECYFVMGDREQALAVVNEGLDVDPGYHVLLNNKGYILFLDHQYEEAVVFFKAALARRPDYKTASVNLADCYRAIEGTRQP